MKILIFSFFILFAFNGIGQVTEKEMFHDLPKEAKYSLITKSFFKPVWHFKKQKWLIKEKIGDSLQLGCSEFEVKGVPIDFMIHLREKKRKGKSMYLFAVKRSDYRSDEKIINALDHYCYYGQHNYYFLSKKYILFTYAISGDYFASDNLKLIGRIENQLVKNLNEIN